MTDWVTLRLAPTVWKSSEFGPASETASSVRPRSWAVAAWGNSPAAAGKGSRPVYWPAKGDFQSTPIYSFEQLRPGNMLAGPAVVEGEYTTLVVPEPLRFSIDEHGLGILE